MLELEIEILEAKRDKKSYEAPLKTLRELGGDARVNDLDNLSDFDNDITKKRGKITEKQGEIADLKKEIREMTNPVQVSQPIRAGKKIDTYDFKMIIFGITFKNR